MLAPLWRFIEARSPAVAVIDEWRTCAGDGFAAVEPMLRPTGEAARSYPNPSPYGLPLRVVRHGDGAVVAVCTEGQGVRIELDRQSVALHELPTDRLARRLAKSLQLDGTPKQLDVGVDHIGDHAFQSGCACAVLFVRARSSGHFESAIRQLVMDAARPMIVITPTQAMWTASAHEVLAKHRSALVAADQLFVDGDWSASVTWSQCTEALRRIVAPDSVVPAPPPYEFRKRGHFWIVRYDGHDTHVKDAVGLSYIAELLASPGRKVFAPDLVEAVTGEPVAAAAKDGCEQTDRQTLDEVKRRYLDLQADLDQAQRHNDQAAEQRLQDELDGLTEYLMQVKGFNGRTRRASDDADKIRRAVTQAIGRAVGWIRADLPTAAAHLDNAIKTGLFVSYEPEQEVGWEL